MKEENYIFDNVKYTEMVIRKDILQYSFEKLIPLKG